MSGSSKRCRCAMLDKEGRNVQLARHRAAELRDVTEIIIRSFCLSYVISVWSQMCGTHVENSTPLMMDHRVHSLCIASTIPSS